MLHTAIVYAYKSVKWAANPAKSHVETFTEADRGRGLIIIRERAYPEVTCALQYLVTVPAALRRFLCLSAL